MFEMYGFILAFSVQILIFSMLGPLRLVDGLRRQIRRFVAEQAPPIDPSSVDRVDRRLWTLRMCGLGTAVVGVLLLIFMIRYMLRPDWTDGPLEVAVPVYFFLQLLPTSLAVIAAGQFHAVLKSSLPPVKRRALLQPRGLFDFVSRSAVAAAVLAYVLFVIFLLYVAQRPFPGFAGIVVNLVGITLVYALVGLSIFIVLRSMGSSPLQTRDERFRSVSLAVRICVFSCIACAVCMTLTMTLALLNQQRWEPTFVSIGMVVMGLLTSLSMSSQMRIPESADRAAGVLSR